MAFEELVEGFGVTGGDLHEQAVGFSGIGTRLGHDDLAVGYYPRRFDWL